MTDPVQRDSIADRVLSRAKQALEIGSDAADVLVHLQHGASPIGLAAVGLRVINSLREHRAQSPEEYFAEGWRSLEIGLLADQAFVACRLDPEAVVREIPSMHAHKPAVAIKLGEHTFGWAISGSIRDPKAQVDGCWVLKEAKTEECWSRIGRAIWTHLGDMGGFIEANEDKDSVSLRVIPEDKGKAFPSKRADDLYDRLKIFLDKEIHRSVFVLGQPGVGKTSMLRYIAARHGGLRLRLRLSKMSDVRPSSLIRVIQILRPDVLLIDDLDRYVMGSEQYRRNTSVENATPEAAEMLDPLEVFNDLIPLVIASANFSDTITAALLRPGRFDELIVVEKLDDEIYRKLLPDVPDKVIDEMIRLEVPVAYVGELKKRVKAMGYEDAAKEMKELVSRSDRILRLNKRKTKKQPSGTLHGKTPRQRAAILDRRAAGCDSETAKLKARIARCEERGEVMRVKAQKERKKADTRDAKKTTAKKPSPKKRTKKRKVTKTRSS